MNAPRRISPMCRREVHATCMWWEVDNQLHRSYWCECECHEAGSMIDLTESPTPDRVEIREAERELVSQE